MSPSVPFPQEAAGLIVDGDDGVGTGLLGDDFKGVALVGGDDDVVPGEALNVGDTETAEAREQAGPLDLIIFARSGGQAAHFVNGEVFFVDRIDVDGIQLGNEVVRDEFVFLGAVDDHLEVHPEVGGAVVGDKALVIKTGFSRQEVLAE